MRIDLRYIQNLLGHENIKTTEIYKPLDNIELWDFLTKYIMEI
ncbi:MAG: hypothetical protein U9R42_04245 [Bacteroidota bacterium]|nr:hypothetical protein [Bacteroidota bacterium]